MKKKRMSDKKALNFISVGISIFAVLVSIWAGVSASNASTEANSIASQQLKITENSYKPEFVYNGPRQTEIVENELISFQPEGYYDYGFEPSFSRISGFASNLSCEAHSHYELTIRKIPMDVSTLEDHVYRSEDCIVALDVYGEFYNSIIEGDEDTLTVYLKETRAKVDPNLLSEALRSWGYEVVDCRSYCVGDLLYTDISDNSVRKPFSIDMKRKGSATFGNMHSDCVSITERVDYDWGALNRGLSDTIYDDVAKELVFKIENNPFKS